MTAKPTKRPRAADGDRDAENARRTRNLVRTWLTVVRQDIDHAAVVQAVYENGGLSGRYLIMTVISAAIATLGLMLSSPAVVIGAMLVSPMMGPIVGLGFSLTLLDFNELRRALLALAVGVGVALLVAVLLTVASPLKEPTAEILARTRPNFFDLLIAIFSGVAGAYAVVKQRGETIIGVAIATALMPPVATVGFGLGTGDLRVAGGASFLFMTNLLAIALAATLTAGFYGFRPRLLDKPRPWQGFAVVGVFIVLAVPLALSLQAIGMESRATAETRLAVSEIFAGADSRVTLLDVRSDHGTITVSALISTRRLMPDAERQLTDHLTAALHAPVTATLDQIVVADPRAAARAVQANQSAQADPHAVLRHQLSDAVPFPTDAVMLDAEGHKAVVMLRPDADLDLTSAHALERGLRARFEELDVWVVPPVTVLEGVDLGDAAAVDLAAWALARWRATPAVRFCRPSPAKAATEDAAARPGGQETFTAALRRRGVTVSEAEGPACRRGDANLARVALG